MPMFRNPTAGRRDPEDLELASERTRVLNDEVSRFMRRHGSIDVAPAEAAGSGAREK